MELLIQAVMESIHEGTLPLAYLIMLIWGWNRPFNISEISKKWSINKTMMPATDRVAANNLRAVEAICSRMIFGKTIKRKHCPDDFEDPTPFLSF